ncbi:hypothetical protein DINM_006500 [Dirofilaria immitis]|nr:hypothetical protein [Dirofilaria immitis]
MDTEMVTRQANQLILFSRCIRSSSSTLLEHNIWTEDLLDSLLNSEFIFQNPILVKELKGKRVIRKSRKQINTTTIKESQYAKKIFIYRGSFLTFCSVSLGTYFFLILSVQIWILISRLEIKNGVWSLSPAETTTWWFDQVENLDDESVKFCIDLLP